MEGWKPIDFRFARQWTVPSAVSQTSDAATATIEFPPRHAASLSPLRREPEEPHVSCPTLAQDYVLRNAVPPSTSPSPLRPLHARQPSSHERTPTHSAQGNSDPSGNRDRFTGVLAVEPRDVVVVGDNPDGSTFWRREAQRLERMCTALQVELNEVYQFLSHRAAGFSPTNASNARGVLSCGCHEASRDDLIQERNSMRIQIAQEREKSFLIRHRLREVEAEMARLQQRLHRQEAIAVGTLSRANRPSDRATSLMGELSRPRCSRGRTQSTFSSSTSTSSSSVARGRLPSPPRLRSGTRPETSAPHTSRQKSPPLARPFKGFANASALSTASSNSRASTSSVPGSVAQVFDSRRSRPTVAVAANSTAECHLPLQRSTCFERPLPSPTLHERRAQDRLTSLLSAHTSTSHQRVPSVERPALTASYDLTRSQSTSASPTKNLFPLDLAGVSAEEKKKHEAVYSARGPRTPRGARRSPLATRLLSPTPPRRHHSVGHDQAPCGGRPFDSSTHSAHELLSSVRSPKGNTCSQRSGTGSNSAAMDDGLQSRWRAWQSRAINPLL